MSRATTSRLLPVNAHTFVSGVISLLFAAFLLGCGPGGSSEPASDIEELPDASLPELTTPSAELEILSPNGGEVLIVGQTVMTAWESEDLEILTLELLDSSLMPVHSVSDVEAGPGSLVWNLPEDVEPGGLYRVRLQDAEGSGAADISDRSFTIVEPAVEVVSPAPGTRWRLGSTVSVEWEAPDTVAEVDISLWQYGMQVDELASAVSSGDDANGGSWEWEIPVDYSFRGADFVIRVAAVDNPELVGVSAPFRLESAALRVLTPAGDEIIPTGEELDISWQSEVPLEQVRISLWQDENEVFGVGEEPDVGMTSWLVSEDFTPGRYRVRVADAARPGVFDESEGFLITDVDCQVNAPAAGSSFAPGDPLTIEWSCTGAADGVDVSLLRPDKPEQVLATGLPVTGTHSWQIPNAVAGSDEYVVSVRETTSSIEALSPPFTITGWRYRIPVQVDSADGQSDGPLLLPLQQPVLAELGGVDGSAIRVSTSPDISTGFDLPVWRAQWGSGTGARVWTRTPLSAGRSTFWLWVGAEGVADVSDYGSVFQNVVTVSADTVLTGVQEADAWILPAGVTVSTAPEQPLEVHAAYIEVAGTIDADLMGYAGGTGLNDGAGPGGGSAAPDYYQAAGGGGHGGQGGDGEYNATVFSAPAGGPVYGSTTGIDLTLGSGGGGSDGVPPYPTSNEGGPGGAGGGAVALVGQDVTVSGVISADGESIPVDAFYWCPGGGSGGSVVVQSTVVTLSGTITANGGNGGVSTDQYGYSGGGGAGGRIKILYSHSVANDAELEAYGGSTGRRRNSADVAAEIGESGTVVVNGEAPDVPAVILGAVERP